MIKIQGLQKIIDDVDIYYGDACPEFLPLGKDNDYDCYELTHCKEELGANCVENKLDRVVVILDKAISEKQIEKIKKKLHKFEKKVKVRCSKVEPVKGCKRAIYFKYSPRWSKNSVAHSIWATMVRKIVLEEIKADSGDDQEHLRDAEWLINLVNKKGLSIFGPQNHKTYDTGMVNLIYRLNDFGGYIQPSKKNFQQPKPVHAGFDDYADYLDALAWWKDELYYWEEEEGGYIGEYDERISGNHAYKKIEKEYRKDFKV